MSSEKNKTPLQLWTDGLFSLAGSPSLIGQELLDDPDEIDDDTFDVDWDEMCSDEVDDDSVIVSEVCCPLDLASYGRLQQAVDPLAPSDSFAIDLYIHAFRFVQQYCT